MLDFLLDYLRFYKLLKLHKTEGRISNNLLKRNPTENQASCATGFIYSKMMLRALFDS